MVPEAWQADLGAEAELHRATSNTSYSCCSRTFRIRKVGWLRLLAKSVDGLWDGRLWQSRNLETQHHRTTSPLPPKKTTKETKKKQREKLRALKRPANLDALSPQPQKSPRVCLGSDLRVSGSGCKGLGDRLTFTLLACARFYSKGQG